MLFKNSDRSTVLLTTPDYPPKLGGLSTLCKSIEKALKATGVDYDILVWDNVKGLKDKEGVTHRYKLGIHIHFMGCHYLKKECDDHINFIHGSEILFTSPNFLKKIYKKIFKRLFTKSLKESLFNVCISEYSQKLLGDILGSLDYSRDIIFQNCINTESSKDYKKSLNDQILKMICVARDVPHKNISAALIAAEALSKTTKKEVILYVTKDLPSKPMVKVINISDITDEKRNELLASCHFNLLLSLDHRGRGFVEGFGLTVLEAGLYGTPSIVSPFGGLPEACHHDKTGWVVKPQMSSFDDLFQLIDEKRYQRVRKAALEHTLESHDEGLYNSFFKRILEGRGLL